MALAVALLPAATASDERPGPAASTVPEVLTLDEAAHFLRLKPQVVAELARSHSLAGRHVDGQWRFLRAALIEWLKGDRFAGIARPAPVTAAQLQDIRGGGAVAQAPGSIGEKPNAPSAEETALRDQGVLLLPAGGTTVEMGVSYARAERENLGLLRVEQSTAAANLALRYGLRDDLQVSLRLPATYRRLSTKVTAALGDSVRTSDTYLGDLSASLLGVFSRERTDRPNVILSADVMLPTGPGDRGLGAGIVVSKSFDPIVLFGGVSYLRGWKVDDADPRRLLARNNFGFNFGYAYALNDSVALSGVFSGTYKTHPGGPRATGIAPSRESYQLQFGATMQIGRGLFVEPMVGVGVGGSAPDVTLLLNLPYTF
jgi:hypothetical protein